MAVLYKENDYVIREIQNLSTSYLEKNNSQIGTQIVFGTCLYTPNIVHTYETSRDAHPKQSFVGETHGSEVGIYGMSVDYSDERIYGAVAQAKNLKNFITRGYVNGLHVTNLFDGTFPNGRNDFTQSQYIARVVDTRSTTLSDIGQIYFDTDPFIFEFQTPGLPIGTGERIQIINFPEIPEINGRYFYVARLPDLRESLRTKSFALYYDSQLTIPVQNSILDGNPYRVVVGGEATITPSNNAIYSYALTIPKGKGWKNYLNGQSATTLPGSNFGSYNILLQYNRANKIYGGTRTGDTLEFQRIFDSIGRPFNDDNQELLYYYMNKETKYFGQSNNLFECVYTRYPIISDPTQSNQWYRVSNEAGNCILELLQNPVYGLGISNDDIEYSDFYDVGEKINGSFDLENSSISDIIKTLESIGNVKLVKNAGKIGLHDQTGRGATVYSITDDVIISGFEVQETDLSTVPTGIRATYKSYERGLVNLEIGTGPNYKDIFLEGVSDSVSAKAYLTKIFQRLRTSKIIRFSTDKSSAKLLTGNKIQITSDILDSTFESYTWVITELAVNDDFTYNIVAKTDDSVEDIPRSQARPILPRGTGFYRPPEIENPIKNPEDEDQEKDDEGQPITPAPDPGEVTPPAPLIRTYSGLSHPYNWITGTENTDWYLGAVNEVGEVDDTFDANGIRTTVVQIPNQGAGIVFKNQYGLIYRQIARTPPVAIWAVSDIGTTANEKSLGYLGFTKRFDSRSYRFHFDNIFNETLDYKIKYISNRNTTWQTLPNSLTNFEVDAGPVYSKTANNSLDYVYTNNYNGTFDIQKVNFIFSNDPRLNVRQPAGGIYRQVTTDQKYTGRDYYRLHYFAVYSTGKTIADANRLEYIGSTSFYGDGRGVQAADLAASQRLYAAGGGIAWPYGAPSSPPSRSGA